MNIAPNENSDRPLIICLYSSVGSGHRSAAISTAQAFEALRGKHPKVPADCEIEVLDILDFGRIKFDGEETTKVFTGPTRYIYDITWHYVFTGRFLHGGGSGWSYVMYHPFTKYVRKRKPIAIISTHIVAANAASAARMITGLEFPVVCVPTDFGVEGLWPHRFTDLFCVADEHMKQELIPRKVRPENIAVTGIPVSPSYDRTYDRAEVLDRFGLPKDKKIVLVLAGARLRQPYVLFREVMGKIFYNLAEFKDMHFVFLAGSDAEYAVELRDKCQRANMKNVSVFDYIHNVAELMSAADLAIAKSGGLVVSECLASHLPLVIVGRSFGQERANTATVTRAGAAYQVFNAAQLLEILKIIECDPTILNCMVDNGRPLSKPDSAERVALATLDRVGYVQRMPNVFLALYMGGRPLRVR